MRLSHISSDHLRPRQEARKEASLEEGGEGPGGAGRVSRCPHGMQGIQVTTQEAGNGTKKQWRKLTGKHGVEVGAAGRQHHFVRLDFLVGDVEHDVTQQAALSHSVHGHEGVVVVPFGVV